MWGIKLIEHYALAIFQFSLGGGMTLHMMLQVILMRSGAARTEGEAYAERAREIRQWRRDPVRRGEWELVETCRGMEAAYRDLAEGGTPRVRPKTWPSNDKVRGGANTND